MRPKYIKFLLTTLTVIFLSSLVTISASAVQYDYDDLNRLTAAGEDNGATTQYQYDAGGNLLSVTTVPNVSNPEVARSLPDGLAGDSVMDGWIPYFTGGVSAQYSVIRSAAANNGKASVQDNIYGAAPAPAVTVDVYGNSPAPAYPVQVITANSGIAGGANVYKDVTISSSETYSISGEVSAEQLQHAAVQVIVNYYDARNHLIGYENAINVLETSDWSEFSKLLQIPDTAVKARVHLQILILEAEGSGIANFADLSLEPYRLP
ncbi:RHS repeat domain-containing protein [Paenibacillus sp. IHB B 3415]|uniref:RHS repeat domain-containing protein n=1 Tax=Paenibacillus sp. IHB B 3415 TaxID=867080 RepID=UPI0009FB6664|nr:RHS repeat domain-containing protein [Paenibacillus sp. IHB B 3415]